MDGVGTDVSEVILTRAAMRGMAVAATFPLPEDLAGSRGLNKLAFSDDGKWCVGSEDSGMLQLFSTTTARRESVLHDSELGATEATYTHHKYGVLYTSISTDPKKQGKVVYRDLYTDSIVHEYNSHTDQVTSISMSPANDTFVTTSYDGNVNVWDIRCAAPIARLETRTSEHLRASYHSSGAVIAVVLPGRVLSLYNAHMLHCEPFKTATFMDDGRGESVQTTAVEFSDDAAHIAVATLDRGIALVDAFELTTKAVLNAHPHSRNSPCDIAFTPDGQFVVTGGEDGRLYAYDLTARDDRGEVLPQLFSLGDAHRTVDVNPSLHFGSGAGGVGAGAGVGAAAAAGAGAGAGAGSAAASRQRYGKEEGLKHDLGVNAVAWHPDKALLATADKTVAFWTLPTRPGGVDT